MKSKWIAVLAILLAAVSGFSGLAHAEQIAKKQVTENSYEDSSPQIKGNYLVWQGQVGGDWEIFLYNVATTGEDPVQVTDNDYGDILPQTDGNYVVWLGFSQPGSEIFLYDILSGETTQITNDSHVDSSPQIANGRVVWTSHQVGDSVEPGEIILYDIVKEERTILSSYGWIDPGNNFDDSSPRINDDSVMWVQAANDTPNPTLYVYDLNSPVVDDTNPAPAGRGFVWEDSPQTDGNLTVYTRVVGDDREIFVRNTGLTGIKTYEQITNNDLKDRYPRISGNRIAWVAGEGKMREIYLAFYGEDTSTDDGGGGGDTDTSTGDGGGGGGGGLCFIATAAFTW